MSGAQLADLRAIGDDRAQLHPGLIGGAMPGSVSCLDTPAQPSSPGWATCGGVQSPTRGRRRIFIACENLSLSLRNEPASQAPREGSDVFPRHGSHHEGSNVREVVNYCRG